MHLAILTQYYPPEIGAPQARLAETAQLFTARGHEVSVLTAMPNYPVGNIHAGYGGVVRRETSDGINIIRTFIYPTQTAAMIRRLTNYFSFVLSSATVGAALLERPDFLMIESPPLFLGLSGMWLSALKGCRMIFNVSDLWPESPAAMGLLDRTSLAYRLSSRLELACYRRAWMVSGQSRTILSHISQGSPGVHTYHLSNGVDTRLFSPARRTPAARACLTDHDRKCVVFYAGLHGLAQGLDQVIEAAAALRDQRDLEFVLIGDGPEKRALRAKATASRLAQIRFLDPMPKAEIPALIASSDIVVVPLKQAIPGAVPSKIYEAMSSAKPIVLVATGEAADIVRTHNAGLVVQPGDVEGLVRALRTLHADPTLRHELGQNGLRAALNFYDRTTIGNRFVTYLEDQLNKDHRARGRAADDDALTRS